MKGFNQLREECYYKTGRKGVVFEAIDQLAPNLFDNNRNISAEIFSRSSKFRFTIVKGGIAPYYNLDPDEVLLLTYILSDGMADGFKNRVGAYNALSGKTQVQVRKLVETFDCIDFNRFDRMMTYDGKKGTAIHLQKNIHIGQNKLLIRKLTISYEEAMNSDSKWKVTIEVGEGIKDNSKGNGLNIVKYGTYKETEKQYVMLQGDEIATPVNEAAKRVTLSQGMSYYLMKKRLDEFNERKNKNNDPNGEKIDEWNPEGKPKFPAVVTPKKPVNKTAPKPKKEEKTETKTDSKKELACSDCGTAIDKNVHDYSLRVKKKALCIPCQRK